MQTVEHSPTEILPYIYGNTNRFAQVEANGMQLRSQANDRSVILRPAGAARRGSYDYPFSTVAQAAGAVPAGGTIALFPGSGTQSVLITTPLRIQLAVPYDPSEFGN
jgi:hypothetical protein